MTDRGQYHLLLNPWVWIGVGGAVAVAATLAVLL